MTGQYMSPQVQNAGPIAATAPSADTHKGWMDYLTHPTTRAALMQFGVQMLAGSQTNQSFGANFAQSVGSGGAAAGREQQYELQQEKQAEDTTATQRQLTIAEDNAAQNKAQTGIAEKRLGVEEEQNVITREKNVADAANAAAELPIKQQQADQLGGYYKALGGAAANKPTKDPPGFASAMSEAVKAALLNADESVEGETYEDLLTKYTDPIFKKYGLTPGGGAADLPAAGGAPAPTGATSAIPPEAIAILKANPDETTKRMFDQTFGVGEADKALGVK